MRPGRLQRLRRPAGALAFGQLQTAHEGLRCALDACSTSAALLCPIRTQPPAFISIRVKFVYLHKHENP